MIRKGEKMISKDKINEMFKDAEGIEKEEAIVRAMVKYKIPEDDATKYYTEWKDSYMKSTNNSTLKPKPNTKIRKRSNTETKEELGLAIQEIKLNGSNGTYTVCKEGIELRNRGTTLAFENLQQWEEFKGEIDQVFEYGKSNKILQEGV